MSVYKKLQEDLFEFKRLKNKYPEVKIFFKRYEEGDYYNTSKTFYYDENYNELEYKDNGYYG